MSEEEEELLEATKNNTETNCLLAGILAIDSCVNSLVEMESKTQNELSNAIKNMVNEYKIAGHYILGSKLGQ